MQLTKNLTKNLVPLIEPMVSTAVVLSYFSTTELCYKDCIFLLRMETDLWSCSLHKWPKNDLDDIEFYTKSTLCKTWQRPLGL